MTPTLRFTLFHSTLAPSGLVIPQPDGWKNSSLILERHPEFHSLVETIQGEFVFWGDGMRFIQSVEDLDGPDATLRILIEISYKIGVFEDLFDGLLDISEMEEINVQAKKYKYKTPIIRNDFWTKFINRKSTKIDILSTLDLDGGTRAVLDKFSLPMPSQTIRSFFDGNLDNNNVLIYNEAYSQELNVDNLPDYETITVDAMLLAVGTKIQIDFSDNLILDEVKERFGIPITNVPELTVPANMFKAKYAGTYLLDVRLEASIYSSLATSNGIQETEEEAQFTHVDLFTEAGTYFDLYLQVNNDAPILFAKESSPLVAEKVSTIYTLNTTINLGAGDVVRFYAVMIEDVSSDDYIPDDPYGTPGDKDWNRLTSFYIWGGNNVGYPLRHNSFVLRETIEGGFVYDFNVSASAIEFDGEEAPSAEPIPTFLTIQADTLYPDTESDQLLLGDVAQNLLTKIVGADDVMLSDTLESCKGYYGLAKGLHHRGYSMADKPFAMSFMDWWEGANPILKFGLGYEQVLGVDKIRLERREFFYDKSETSINLTNVSNAVRTYDLDLFIKQIEVGYTRWSAESESGIDDPQTKRNYRTRFAKIGKDEKLLSKFIAASLAIEQTRRNRVEFGKDWRLDEDVMIIALKLVEGNYVPELGTDFALVTNLLNPDTRYNIRLSSARNFERWRNWYNGCLSHLAGEKFFFASGEGNFDMVSTLNDADCDESENNELSEKQDIDADQDDFIILPIKRELKHSFDFTSYKTVRDNRELAIGVNIDETNDLYPHFIKRLEWKIMGGFANFNVNLADRNAEDIMLFQDEVSMAFQDGQEMKYN